MSERDLKRIEVLNEVVSGRRTVAARAAVLAISEGQAYRLLARYEAGGGATIFQQSSGVIAEASESSSSWR